MKPLACLGCLLLVAALTLPGCAWFAPKQPASPTDAAPATTSPEAEVKPAPVNAPLAAAPPAAPLKAPAATAAETTETAETGAPEGLTKQTLEPKPIQTAALPQPKIEPAPQIATPAAKTPEEKPTATKTRDKAIAVVGDSLAVGIGMTMEQHTSKYDGVGCHPLGKVSTGLISKKFFDWEKTLTELVATEKLAAVVVMMGGNDANNPIAGKPAGTPEWGEAYRQKVESFLKIAANAGVKVLWVGLPAMRDPAYAARVKAVNASAKDACAKVGGCAYMEASEIFTDASGNYVQAKDIGGKTVSLRAKDGVHMTMTGYDLLCRQVLDKLAASGALPTKP